MREALLKYSAYLGARGEVVELLDSIGIQALFRSLTTPLMLTREDWGQIASNKRIPAQPYILIYQLNKNPEFDQYAQKPSKKLGLPPIASRMVFSERRRGEHTIVRPRVEEFLGLFLSAEYVLTDSFPTALLSP